MPFQQIVAIAHSSGYILQTVSVQMIGVESPLYLTARQVTEDPDRVRILLCFSFLLQLVLSVWAGVEQIASPHLVESYQKRLKRIAPWLKDVPGTAFAITISILGERLPKGIWRFLSSPAYLGANNWFVMFSGGMLSPRSLDINVSH